MEELLEDVRWIMQRADVAPDKIEEVIDDLQTHWHDMIAITWSVKDVQNCIEKRYGERLYFDVAIEILQQARALKCDGVTVDTFCDLYSLRGN